MQDVKDLSRERESICQQICISKVEIRRILQTLFPEVEKLADPFTKTMLYFLKQFPSARMVKQASRSKMAKTLKQTGCGASIQFTADDMIKAARTSVATISPAKEVILRGKIDTLEHLQKRCQDLGRLLAQSCECLAIQDMEILTSIKGISQNTPSTFLAELGPISNYSSARKIIVYAGIDPSVYQSGKFVAGGKISKRGNRHLRRVIWLMAVRVIQYSKWFKAYYQKKRADGQPYKKAVLATAHKLVRVIYSMLTHRIAFQEAKI